MEEVRDYLEKPLIFFGDFNEISFEEEKEGGRSRRENQMQALRDVVDRCGLKDLGLVDELFTWPKGGIKEILDRCLADVNWHCKFSNAKVLSYARYPHNMQRYCWKQSPEGGYVMLINHSSWNLCGSMKRVASI